MNQNVYTGKTVIYDKFRPQYAEALIDYLYTEVGFNAESSIADIGSGTGIFSEQLLQQGSFVYGIEPNEEMRLFAEEKLKRYEKFQSIGAFAEKTSLIDSSIDFVTVAQAFHWFDVDRFKEECKRILKDKGIVSLIWNTPLENSIINQEVNSICMKYCEKNYVGKHNWKPDIYSCFYSSEEYQFKEFSNDLIYDLTSFLGINQSTSYSPKPNSKEHRSFLLELEDIFTTYQHNELITIPNVTQVITGSINV